MVKVGQKPENAAQPVIGPIFHSSAWRTSTHDALWRALSSEVWRGAHALNCSVTEVRGYIERRLSSTRSIRHVYVRDECGRLFIEMSLMGATTAERDFVQNDNKNCATLL